MSQAKVEKRKYEKKHRKELERKRKIKLLTKCVLWSLVIGSVIGVPLALNYYKSIPKFVGDATLKAFVENYIDTNHSAEVELLNAKAKTTESQVKDAIDEAVGQELKEVKEDEVEEVLDTDSTE